MPNTKVVAFTMFDQEEAIKRMLLAGSVGYILKISSLQIVLESNTLHMARHDYGSLRPLVDNAIESSHNYSK